MDVVLIKRCTIEYFPPIWWNPLTWFSPEIESISMFTNGRGSDHLEIKCSSHTGILSTWFTMDFIKHTMNDLKMVYATPGELKQMKKWIMKHGGSGFYLVNGFSDETTKMIGQCTDEGRLLKMRMP